MQNVSMKGAKWMLTVNGSARASLSVFVHSHVDANADAM